MPIANIPQPDFLKISDTLRLRRYDGVFAFALEWYQDEELVYLVDGVRRTYDLEGLHGMYGYLNRKGELYFIEAQTPEGWKPIGDVTFWQQDMPIVIGDAAYRGRGVGKQVVRRLIERGRELGYSTLYIGDIYSFNTASRRCFEALGFRPYEKTELGDKYVLQLSDSNGTAHQ